MLTIILIALFVSSCGHCYLKESLYLTQSDIPLSVAKKTWPRMLGQIEPVVDMYRGPDLFYDVWHGDKCTPWTVDALLRSGYRVVVVVPSMGDIWHAYRVTDGEQVRGKRILYVHLAKDK